MNADIDAALAGASDAATAAAEAPRHERARWLRLIADRLDGARPGLVDIAARETHLATARLEGEVARTTGQLRLFADVITEGSYLEAVVDPAQPTASPPRPEIRRYLRPLGPVAVFSASNFPFAFSVAGGDTASALAAGCPVIVKGHSGHPELSRATAEVVNDALDEAEAPRGMVSLVLGREAGRGLVSAAPLRAVAFTGSVDGGRGLMATIGERADPIPFYGELGSLNPVVVTSAAVEMRADEIARGLVASFSLGAGQFCTKPGLVFVPAGFAANDSLRSEVEKLPDVALLTERIADAFPPGVRQLLSVGGVDVVAGSARQHGDGISPVVLRTSVANLLRHSETLLEETFGPVTVLVEYAYIDEVFSALALIGGSLTATVHSHPRDRVFVARLTSFLAERAGRIVFDGWPTGVAVSWGQHHGGPWPATTTQHTSVGATAIRRFLRPVAFQDAPLYALPVDLRDDALRHIPHRFDGRLVLPQEMTHER